MRSVLILSLVAMLAGCGQVDRATAQFTGYSKSCIDGVTYLQFASGATVQVDVNGKPIPCR